LSVAIKNKEDKDWKNKTVVINGCVFQIFPERSRGLSRSRREPFRKGGEKTTLTRKRGHHAHNMFPPSYQCIWNLSPSTAKAATTAYTYINVAIVTRLHFGNAKPKFHMNCWPTISINDRSCRQRCI